ncbi:hypothetical protein [Lachnospira multipara]|uniref:Uncharacterized protein n=1 Tax=Lachnospira multipara TaxID=28051 RepID=A0A1H5RJR7_9FIRM|nr:hypothetical protein [Lachnospira multipara]SEF38609.1 hypothetical protein SAMN05216537_10143 [Lachnospira multipara]
MRVEFSNGNGKRVFISEVNNVDDAISDMSDYMENHRFNAMHMKARQLDNEWKIDVGSWTEFFYVSDYKDKDVDELKSALEEFNKYLQF